MSDNLVTEFYTNQVHKEWRRLVKDAYHCLEFATTLHFLEKYLPAQGTILDAGGGPGRYTMELAKKGYDVTLLDATQANLDFAKNQVRHQHLKARVKQIIHGSIADLSMFPEATFDGVMCTGGPLSHLLRASDRAQAISELVRVAKPGAPIFVSVMSRLSVLTVILMIGQHEIEMAHFDSICETGDYFGGHGFTACHFFLPEELLEAFNLPGIQVLETVGLEGVSTHMDRQMNKLAKNEVRYQIWLKMHLQTCTHPAVFATSEHMLVICRKS